MTTLAQCDFVWSMTFAKSETNVPTPNSVGYDDILPLFNLGDIDVLKLLHEPVRNKVWISQRAHAWKVFEHYNHTSRPFLPMGQPQWSPYLRQLYTTWMNSLTE